MRGWQVGNLCVSDDQITHQQGALAARDLVECDASPTLAPGDGIQAIAKPRRPVHLEGVPDTGAMRHVHPKRQQIAQMIRMEMADEHGAEVDRIHHAGKPVERARAHIEYYR